MDVFKKESQMHGFHKLDIFCRWITAKLQSLIMIQGYICIYSVRKRLLLVWVDVTDLPNASRWIGEKRERCLETDSH